MQNFTWVALYSELAKKLLDYKDNRLALVNWIYDELGKVTTKDGKSLVAYLKMRDGSKIQDIDPFSVFGIFNRTVSWDNKITLLQKFKEHFKLESDVPSDFNGIPTLDARNSFFFSWESDNEKVIKGMWNLYEKVIKDEDIEDAFNKVLENGMAKYSLTMCLYWIAPEKYISLDSRNRAYLDTYGIADNYSILRYAEYKSFLNEVKEAMDNGQIPASSFIDFSYKAWIASAESPRVWMWKGDENTFKQTELKTGSAAKGLLDFSTYTKEKAFTSAYKELVDNKGQKTAEAYWNFMHKAKAGDIVVVFSTKKAASKQHLLYGWGRFTSDITFHEGDENPIQRNVAWHLPALATPIIESKTKSNLFFHLIVGIEADNIIRLLHITQDAKLAASTTDRNYWLVGYSFDSTDSQFERFIKDSVWEGGFGGNNKSDQKILPLAKTVKKGDVLILKSTSTKGPRHDQPFLRVKAIAVVNEDIQTEKHTGYTLCKCSVKYYGIKDRDFEDATLASFRKTFHLADAKAQPVIDYANTILAQDNMAQQKYKEYTDLLLDNHNLILTGAPGTGKTYMAKKMAEEMDAEWDFVQFHPSYDYTDFVEGFRPIEDKGEFGFKLKNGIFKAFCAKALQNLIDSKKSKEALQQETSAREKIDEYLDNVIDSANELETLGTKNKFKVLEYNEKTIIVEVPANEKTGTVRLPKSDLISLVENNASISDSKAMRDYFGRKYTTQPDAYIRALYDNIQEYNPLKTPTEVSQVKEKKYVFIIDEINRGEISKIFGELFFSIDPGYRGEKGKVNTQYQNMIEDDDVFKNGFFVPENVYIIGTMNDIDRSVESMDFAMRRRFAWCEITAKKSMKMLDSMDQVSAEELEALKNRMINLNKAIAKTDGLNEAYQIGGAYFMKYAKYHNFDSLWNNHLKGLLYEYLRGSRNDKTLLEDLHAKYNNDVIDEGTADNQG